ncbi:MAG: 30S ribosomal protein S6 [Planctomycetota bacterium]
MRLYEGMFLVDSALVQKDGEQATNIIVSILQKHKCEVLRVEKWNERKLAYVIKKQDRGTYYVIHFNTEPSVISLLRRDCQLSESILRTMITVCPVPLEKLPPIGVGPRDEAAPRESEEKEVFRSPVRQRQSYEHEGVDEEEEIDAFNLKEVSSKPYRSKNIKTDFGSDAE